MSKKKAKADDGVPELHLDDAAVRTAQDLMHKWRLRIKDSVGAVKEVQQALVKSAAALESRERDLQQIHFEAALTAALKVDELKENRRPASAASNGSSAKGKGAKGSRPSSKTSKSGSAGGAASASSAAAAAASADAFDGEGSAAAPDALTAAVLGIEEKKKAKVMAALTAYYSAPRSMSPTSPGAGRNGSPSPPPVEGAPVVLGAAALRLHAHNSESAAAGTVGSGDHADDTARRPFSGHSVLSNASNARLGTSAVSISESGGAVASGSGRPRDVPQALWDCVTELRVRRFAAEEEVEALSGVVTAYLQRLELLQGNCMVAKYGFDGAENELRKAILAVNPQIAVVPPSVLRMFPPVEEVATGSKK